MRGGPCRDVIGLRSESQMKDEVHDSLQFPEEGPRDGQQSASHPYTTSKQLRATWTKSGKAFKERTRIGPRGVEKF